MDSKDVYRLRKFLQTTRELSSKEDVHQMVIAVGIVFLVLLDLLGKLAGTTTGLSSEIRNIQKKWEE